MKKSFMNNIKQFVDSNVRQRIDRVAHNNNEFFGDDLLLVERHFEEIRQVCVEAEKRISTMLQSAQSTQSFGAYTQNVQSGLNNLSQNISQAAVGAGTTSANCNNNLLAQNSNNQNHYNQNGEPSQLNSPRLHPNFTLQLNRPNAFHGNNNEGFIDQSDVETTTQRLTNDIQLRHKKLPVVGFLKFLIKFSNKLRSDSLLATTFTHCSQLQSQLTKLYLSCDQTIETQCLKPIEHLLEVEIPNVVRLRKLFIKSHNDLESLKAKYNGASQKQQHSLQAGHSTNNSYTISQANQQTPNLNKLDNLKKELDDAVTKFEQSKDTYETELYAFVCRETELVDLIRLFYQLQAEYHQQVSQIIQSSVPELSNTLANSSKKLVFGTHLNEHLRCTGRSISPVIEICTHLLYNQGLHEEGLFRVPGSTIKIKKLKNAINAWFVTLATSNIVDDNDQKKQPGHSSVVALHDLFKRLAGYVQTGQTDSPPQKQSSLFNETSNLGLNNDANFRNNNPLYYDVHTIAGLLKLYLRELPEPLFTFAKYDKWLQAVKYDTNDERMAAIKTVLQQLPKNNYENLKHLIKFLHLLTRHQEHNKMTSTNLAITMAPSLMWPPNQQLQSSSNDITSTNSETLDGACNSLNAQMSNIGMSASLHAQVLETLIKNADTLLVGDVDFDLPGFEELSLFSIEHNRLPNNKHQDRPFVKSTSPTGISTASSSSFSSNASQSKVSAFKTGYKTHSRERGSMDGIISGAISCDSTASENPSSGVRGSMKSSGTRPMSVCLQKSDYATMRPQRQQPPPIPPMPASRSYLKSTTGLSQPSKLSSRLPAPPAPPAISQVLGVPDRLNEDDKLDETRPRATSLRGTGTISTTTTNTTIATTGINDSHSASQSSCPPNATPAPRPNVPPPDRPKAEVATSAFGLPGINDAIQQISNKSVLKCFKAAGDVGSKNSLHSLTSSGKLRADFEEISVGDIDDDDDEVDISVPNSPVVSLNSVDDVISDDSSFNDNRNVDDADNSLEYSWAGFNLNKKSSNVSPGAAAEAANRDKVINSEQGLHQQTRIQGATKVEKQVLPKMVEPTSTTTPETNYSSAQQDNVEPSVDVLSLNQQHLQAETLEKVVDMVGVSGVGCDTGESCTPQQAHASHKENKNQIAPRIPLKKPPRGISPKISQSTPL